MGNCKNDTLIVIFRISGLANLDPPKWSPTSAREMAAGPNSIKSRNPKNNYQSIVFTIKKPLKKDPKIVPKVSQKYPKSIPKVPQKYPKSIPKVSQKYPKSIPK